MCRNTFTTYGPNKYPAPLGDASKPVTLPSESGSDHIISVNGPSCGISQNLFKSYISSIDSIPGDKPP